MFDKIKILFPLFLIVGLLGACDDELALRSATVFTPDDICEYLGVDRENCDPDVPRADWDCVKDTDGSEECYTSFCDDDSIGGVCWNGYCDVYNGGHDCVICADGGGCSPIYP